MKIGNKANAFLNGEWRKVKAFTKKYTSSKRRMLDKELILQEIKEG